MSKCLITNPRAAKVISKIFEHPNGVYSIYFKDDRDVVWVNSKVELYGVLSKI